MVALFGEPTIQFEIVGKQHGFVSGNDSWNKRTAGPRNWAKDVRAAGIAAGMPEPKSLETGPESPIFIYTSSFFASKAHPDPENVHKLIKDAMFRGAKNGDKYTGGAYEAPQYDDRERTEVTIWFI